MRLGRGVEEGRREDDEGQLKEDSGGPGVGARTLVILLREAMVA